MVKNGGKKSSAGEKKQELSAKGSPASAGVGGTRWGKILYNPHFVQIFGGLIVAILSIWLVAKLGPWFSQESLEKSRLPNEALGLFLASAVVSAGTDEKSEAISIISEYGLEVIAGRFNLNLKRAAVSSLQVKTADGARTLFNLIGAEVGGSRYFADIPDINCGFRLDLLTSQELFDNSRFIILIESWSLLNVKGKDPCPINFDLNRRKISSP